MRVLLDTFLVTAVATVLALGLGMPAGLTLSLASGRGRLMWRVALLAVLALPPFFVAGMWMELVGFAGAWRAGEGEWVTRFMPLACTAVVLALLLWPIAALLLAGVWDRIDGRLLEAHPGLAGGPLFRHVLWPPARAILVAPAALIASLALSNFAVPSLFQARVWPEEIWVEFSTRFDAGAAWWKSAPLMVVALVLAATALRRPLAGPVTSGSVVGPLLRTRLGRVGRVGAGLMTLVGLVLALGIPVVLAGGTRRTWVELPTAFAAAWPALIRSVVYAGGAATLVLGFGVAAARFRWPLITAPAFFLPGIFTGMVVLRVAERVSFDSFRDSAGIVIVALVMRYAFVGWVIAARVWRGADRRLREVARMAGASAACEWRHVVGPGARGTLAAAWSVAFVLGLWDVETLVLIVPPGGDSLALMVFNLLHYGHNAQVSALCVWLAGAAVVPWVVAGAVRWGGGGGRRAGARGAILGVLAAWVGWGAVGCSPAPTAGSAAVTSRLFDSVQVIGRRGNGPGEFQKPRSVAVDGEDNLFVVDMTGRVQKFGADGRWRLTWQMPETDLGKPKGMATAPDGGVLIVEPHYHRVNRFAPDGRLLAQWGTHGTNAGELWFPRAIAVGTNGDCFVSEYGRVERVQRFRADGAAFVNGFGTEGTGPGQLNRAEGLGVDLDGSVLVADSCNHRVQVFSPEGRWLRSIGRPGQGSGEFSYPYDVRVDRMGLRYVCEFGNSRVQVLDAQDRPVEILGGAGSAPGRMNNPWSLCLDSRGDLYVADSLNHRVLRFHRRS